MAFDESVVKNLLSWHHTGFSAYVGHEIAATDRAAREAVASYLVHPPVAIGRILTEGNGDQVIYKAKKLHPRHGANFRDFDPLAFIAEVVSHIPNVHEKTAIHYGWYSNKTRGTRKAKAQHAASADPSDETSAQGESSPTDADRPPIDVRRNWARLLCRLPACVYLLGLLPRVPSHGGCSSRPPRGMVLEARRHPPHSVPPEAQTVREGQPRSPPPASSSGSSREPQYEPLYDDLPWEEPTFEDGRPLDDGEPTLDDRPLDDGRIGDTA